MTNQPDQDRIEGAKLIVEFMPDWEWDDGGFWICGEWYIWKVLKRDRNLLHEVLTEIEERGLLQTYSDILVTKYRKVGMDKPRQITHGIQIQAKADSETIFDAIVACLEGEVE